MTSKVHFDKKTSNHGGLKTCYDALNRRRERKIAALRKLKTSHFATLLYKPSSLLLLRFRNFSYLLTHWAHEHTEIIKSKLIQPHYPVFITCVTAVHWIPDVSASDFPTNSDGSETWIRCLQATVVVSICGHGLIQGFQTQDMMLHVTCPTDGLNYKSLCPLMIIFIYC